jgi:hypothetical protein
LPPVDLTPVKTGRFVPAWAAQAGLAAPLPPEPLVLGDPDDLVDLLMQTSAGQGAGHGWPAAAGRDSAPEAPVTVAPPERDIAIEVD